MSNKKDEKGDSQELQGTPIPKTRDDVEVLKESWIQNPVDNIEETPGFEEFHDELLQFRTDQEAIWQAENDKALLEQKLQDVFELKEAYTKDPKTFTEQHGNLEDVLGFAEFKEELLALRLETESKIVELTEADKQKAIKAAYIKMCNANAFETLNMIDYIAAEAMKTLIAYMGNVKDNIPHVAQRSYDIAFAMATEKQKREQELTDATA